MLPGMKALLNYHPLFVHFPIALWIAALVFELLAAWRKNDEWHATAVRSLYFGTLAGILAAWTGWMAQNSVVPDREVQDVLEDHKLVMLITTSVAVGLCMFAYFMRKQFSANARRFFLIGLVILCTLLVFGADRGGFLVFHYGQSVNFTTTH